ncbi:MAG TPA: beta-N-acetylhexosaminidase, partial [Clostridiales bacterium]|nr:beta-N-acetylhexosaminidase [Clostridiales bacterium]
VSSVVNEKLSLDLNVTYTYGKEAFCIYTVNDEINICADSVPGKIYAAYSLLQQSYAYNGKINKGIMYAEPQCKFRGLKVYMPAPDDLDSFYKTVDMLLYYRYNKIIIEVGGAMEYKRHPEINEAWITYCEDMGQYPDRANEVQHMFAWDKNSIHFENGGGKYLTQETVRELVGYCKRRGMEVIPEVPSLSHADYLLMPHPELAERQNDPYPDVYCPSNPESYNLLFDVMDEVIDVFDPSVVHIGHDEYYSIGICDRCKGKDGAEIYAGDIQKIVDYLKERNIRTMLWSEKLINAIGKAGQPYGGSEYRYRSLDGQVTIRRPATYRSIDMVPRDIIAHHWYWGIREGFDDEYLKRGIELVYGNFSPHRFLDWNRRLQARAQGGSPSHWSSLCEDTLQRNGVLLELVYGAYLFWCSNYNEEMYESLLKQSFYELYMYKNRDMLKKSHFEITHTTDLNRKYVYISSLPMQKEKDTVGNYLITYEDGSVLEIPIVYGLNISNRERSWTRSLGSQTDAYQTDSLLIETSYTTLPLQIDKSTYFKFVVANPYPDKKIISFTVQKKDGIEDFNIYISSFKMNS